MFLLGYTIRITTRGNMGNFGNYQVYKVASVKGVKVIHNYNVKKCLNPKCKATLRYTINFKNKINFCEDCSKSLSADVRAKIQQKYFKHMDEMQDAKFTKGVKPCDQKHIYGSPFRTAG